jgi:hypothetical protein
MELSMRNHCPKVHHFISIYANIIDILAVNGIINEKPLSESTSLRILFSLVFLSAMSNDEEIFMLNNHILPSIFHRQLVCQQNCLSPIPLANPKNSINFVTSFRMDAKIPVKLLMELIIKLPFHQ